jgi:hypothetical protein
MKPWRDDPRFKCPTCARTVYLSLLDPAGERATRNDVVAICIPCQRVFFVEEWRKLHPLHKPHIRADS